jgi:hypothetical protein
MQTTHEAPAVQRSTHNVSIAIDLDALTSYTDQYLATCWHAAQANSQSSFDSPEPEQIAEAVGREIIRRWLAQVPPALWHVKGGHFRFGEHQRAAALDIVRVDA